MPSTLLAADPFRKIPGRPEDPVDAPLPAAVVVAAGASRRMGTPKALLPWDGSPLALAHVRALAPWSRTVVVVLGAGAGEVGPRLPGVRTVVNARWDASGMIGSVAVGLAAVGPGPAWIVPVDTLPAPADVLRALLAAGGPAVPVDPEGVAGHPVLLDARTVAAVVREPPAGGLREILGGAGRVPVSWPVAVDFDTPADLARAREILERTVSGEVPGRTVSGRRGGDGGG